MLLDKNPVLFEGIMDCIVGLDGGCESPGSVFCGEKVKPLFGEYFERHSLSSLTSCTTC